MATPPPPRPSARDDEYNGLLGGLIH